jgi:ectoine hydroxylase-related dioxygenase (phytanoyl-CoA dioxygenase family)
MSVAVADSREPLDLSKSIRDLTKEEISFFVENGWVHAPAFIDPQLADEVVQHYMDWTGLKWKDWPSDPKEQQEFRDAVDGVKSRGQKGRMAIRQSDPWMFNFIAQRKFGEAAARLLNVPSIKPLSDTLHVKYPMSSGQSFSLPWHQDFPAIPADRAEACQMWLALVPITPDMGPMVHLSGSQHEKPGGMFGYGTETAEENYPEIFEKYKPSTPKALGKGDAVFHDVLTYHCSGLNLTDKVRWAMSSIRISARSLYTGQFNINTNDLGLTPLKPFDHPNFPTVYP